MAKINLKSFKKLIEGKILQFATANKNSKPNLICVEGNKVINDSILITNNQMGKTFKNLKENKKVALVAYNPGRRFYGYQFKGTAKYFTSGKYFELVKRLTSNKGWNPKAQF